MKTDILVIGAGASGMMAAYSAARTFIDNSSSAQVTLLEKMPRPGRKLMITGKGRCNFTNMKAWNEFSQHIHGDSSFAGPSYHSLPPQAVLELFGHYGMNSVLERGDRVFPESHLASDVVDTLSLAVKGVGVKLETNAEVSSLLPLTNGGFEVSAADGRTWTARKLIIATGGLSYPSTGSSGDGIEWAKSLGHEMVTTFPSLTALVPFKYKSTSDIGHIARETALGEIGRSLCGAKLKNVSVQLFVDGNPVQDEFGDIDFTDGGIEGPVGFQLSRRAVKSIINGSKVSLSIDLKSGVEIPELKNRIKELKLSVDKDPRSRNIRDREKFRILLGKLMPWELIPGFLLCNPNVNPDNLAKCLKDWKFDIAGYVGYERAVVTAGGVSTVSVLKKTLESRVIPGLYFCGEVLDLDADTGGYNIQLAFSTGNLAGISAAKSLI